MSLKHPLRLCGFAASVCTLAAAPAVAGSKLTLPATGKGAVAGPGLSITNTQSSASGVQPFAIEGAVTGSGAGGMLGKANALDSVGVEGSNSGTGFGGFFELTGPAATDNDAAIEAVTSAGRSDAKGHYGSAAILVATNPKNLSPAVSITTNGINSYALKVVNTGFIDDKFNSGLPDDLGGIAGFFQISSVKAQFGQAAVYAVHTGGQKTAGSNGRYGRAGMFVIANPNNFDSALVGKTVANMGTGVEGDDFSAAGGVAVFGDSHAGNSAQFEGGSAGSGICSYAGGSGWECPSDRNLKEHFEKVDLGGLLARLDAMPVFYYRMKHAIEPARYVGPTAQDFKAAFGLGHGDTTINTANAQGVALAAAKGLYRRLQTDEAALAADHAEIAALRELVATQSAALARLKAAVGDLSHRGAAANSSLASR
jgi:hypothetical protein